MENEERRCVIIDNGTGYIKAGFSKEEGPRVVFPTLIGRHKLQNTTAGDEYYFGNYAYENKAYLNLYCPIENGIIKDLDNKRDGMEKIWEHCFTNKLNCEPNEHKVMLTEASMSQNAIEKMASIMFETFNVPALYIANPAVLSLYSVGKFNGIVCESGDSISQFVPCFDGKALPFSMSRSNIAGREVTKYLHGICYGIERFYKTPFNSYNYPSEFFVFQNIKEDKCYVALDYDLERNNFQPQEHILPDGKKITLKDGMFMAPECLFKPELIGYDTNGFGEMCNEAIQHSKENIRKDLYENIIISGGTTMFKGFPERLEKEVRKIAPEMFKPNVKVIANPDRKYAAWIGGSILSSLSAFENMFITKEEYDQQGAAIIHQKFK